MTRRVVLIPVYNEERHLEGLLARLRQVYSEDVLLIDDGSVDRSPSILKSAHNERTHMILQADNRGYGATLVAGFEEVARRGYEYVITMDSDGQHRPDWIPGFFSAIEDWDIVSGSRYCSEIDGTGEVPPDRRAINSIVTGKINEITGFALTDSFCGFKAYRVSALRKLSITEFGYAMPLQVWLQAKHFGLRVAELPVSRIYNDPNRRFGGDLDDPDVRLRLYLSTIEKEQIRWNL
jgi:glycosyltransferase involved in cell wall biosynthesis